MGELSKDYEGPYIVWVDYGTEGWQPKSFLTLEEAIKSTGYYAYTVLTKIVKFEVKEVV